MSPYLAWNAGLLAACLGDRSVLIRSFIKKINWSIHCTPKPSTLLRVRHLAEMPTLMPKFFKVRLKRHPLPYLSTFSCGTNILCLDFYQVHRSSPNKTKFLRSGAVYSSSTSLSLHPTQDLTLSGQRKCWSGECSHYHSCKKKRLQIHLPSGARQMW